MNLSSQNHNHRFFQELYLYKFFGLENILLISFLEYRYKLNKKCNDQSIQKLLIDKDKIFCLIFINNKIF